MILLVRRIFDGCYSDIGRTYDNCIRLTYEQAVYKLRLKFVLLKKTNTFSERGLFGVLLKYMAIQMETLATKQDCAYTAIPK
ncbi:MAG TPA: hypothetical protein VGE44_03975 [Daejeonella sp.]|uniref:hypothetical protein n=1 Tax=Daejeonella sp. TaxID=2805397 RepID=UPI002ED9EF34